VRSYKLHTALRRRERLVIQIVRVLIGPDQREKWLELVQRNAANTRPETGCESYHIGEDVETPNSFTIVERWASLEAQLNHFKTPEFGKLLGALGDIIAGPPEVSIHDVASTLTLEEALSAAGVPR
jgi:quinol monooxygenase YgiN